jgi:hypothetical protein
MDYTIDWSSIPSDIHDENLRQWLGRTIENVLQKEVFCSCGFSRFAQQVND